MKLFNQRNLKKQMIILVLVSAFILLINSLIIYQIINIKTKQDKVINIAGRQRMLTQKMAKESLLILNDDLKSNKLRKTMNEFQNNLEDLKTGNSARNIPAIEDDLIMNRQKKVTELWDDFKDKVEIIINNNSISEKEKALEYIKENNNELLKEVDKTVDLYEEKSIKMLIGAIQIIVFSAGIIILFISWKVVNKLFNKAEKDQLTKIYNKAKFNDELAEEIKRVKRYENNFGLIMYDIDKFKEINDNYGHDVGDEILIELTDLVRKSIRNIDFLARWGGEEFAIITPNSSLDSTTKLANRLRKEIADHDFSQVDSITCSFGVTAFKKEDNIESMLERVDKALYKAKNNGRDKVISL